MSITTVRFLFFFLSLSLSLLILWKTHVEIFELHCATLQTHFKQNYLHGWKMWGGVERGKTVFLKFTTGNIYKNKTGKQIVYGGKKAATKNEFFF